MTAIPAQAHTSPKSRRVNWWLIAFLTGNAAIWAGVALAFAAWPMVVAFWPGA